MTTTTVRNPYKVRPGAVSDPFTPLYFYSEEDFTLDDASAELFDYGYMIDDMIPGDFNLKAIITDIKSNALSFVRTGLICYKVKFLRLYQKSYSSFKDFCEKAIGVTSWQVNRNIESSRVVMELIQNGFTILPNCEAQARPLTKFHGYELCEKWQEVIDNLPPHKITSNSIMEVLGMESKITTLRIPKILKAKLTAKANEFNLTIEEFLTLICEEDIELLIEDLYGDVDEERMKNWEKDLQNITREYKNNHQHDKQSGAESQEEVHQQKEEFEEQHESDETVPNGTLDQKSEEELKDEKTNENIDSKPINLDITSDDNANNSDDLEPPKPSQTKTKNKKKKKHSFLDFFPEKFQSKSQSQPKSSQPKSKNQQNSDSHQSNSKDDS